MSRRCLLGAVFAILALPPLAALGEALWFHAHNRNNGRLVSSGEAREYLLYVPTSYVPGRPAPLVISLHGGGSWPALQRDISLWNELADEHGFLVVYPKGHALMRTRAALWRVMRSREELDKDVRFIADLIGELRARYAVDARRIYVNGLSNGAAMTYVLSCTLSDRVAAVGLVAAAHMLPWSWCEDRRPVPIISFHGTEDEAVPYEGGPSRVHWVPERYVFPHAGEWARNWAARNRCVPEAEETKVATDVTRRQYGGCAGGASVVFFTVHGGGHTWPGGAALPRWFLGHTTRGVDASREMWRFFQAHPLATAERGAGRGSSP